LMDKTPKTFFLQQRQNLFDFLCRISSFFFTQGFSWELFSYNSYDQS
jgi:hypothetical protein